jgi:putative pyruvate formate lyase activating enzyme
MMFKAAYLKLYESGELHKRADALDAIYKNCTLCARNCGVNRKEGKRGTCSAGIKAKICSAHPHFGEERPLVGHYGSGTIFFSHCNLLCLYCQNWDISHKAEGYVVEDEELANVMLKLQKTGCHNINVVTPTHYIPNIVRALVYAVEKDLNIPLVYNTGGYDRVEILKLLDGIVDIYLPDYKYSDGETAAKFSKGAGDYPEIGKAGLKEMHRQVGILKTDDEGIALRGLMIRHLVLPNDIAGTEAFVKFTAEELDPRTYVNIMNQYRPCYKAALYPELSRGIYPEEYQKAHFWARKYKLINLD